LDGDEVIQLFHQMWPQGTGGGGGGFFEDLISTEGSLQFTMGVLNSWTSLLLDTIVELQKSLPHGCFNSDEQQQVKESITTYEQVVLALQLYLDAAGSYILLPRYSSQHRLCADYQ